MGEYKVTFSFNEVTTLKKALKVYKAILEAQSSSAYELATIEDYFRVCATIEEVEKQCKEIK